MGKLNPLPFFYLIHAKNYYSPINLAISTSIAHPGVLYNPQNGFFLLLRINPNFFTNNIRETYTRTVMPLRLGIIGYFTITREIRLYTV